MRAKHLVYALVDPRTLLVRYVGKSSRGMARPRAHTTPSNLRARTHKAAWLRQLKSMGLHPEIVVLETCAESASEREMWWIAYGRLSGWELTNHTDGGEGRVGYVTSDDTRRKISEAQLGRVFTREHRDNHLRSVRSPENKQFQSVRMSGRRASADTLLRMSEATLVQFQNSERRELASTTTRRLWSVPGYREHMVEVHRGKKHSEEHKRKIGAAQRGERNAAKRPEVRTRISAGLKAAWARRKSKT